MLWDHVGSPKLCSYHSCDGRERVAGDLQFYFEVQISLISGYLLSRILATSDHMVIFRIVISRSYGTVTDCSRKKLILAPQA